MRDLGFPAFLERSLTLLETEVRIAFEQMCEQLCGRSVSIRIDGEAVTVRFARGGCAMTHDVAAAPAVEVVSDRATILRLIDAETNLARSVLDERLYVRATPADALRFVDGLTSYLHGAVRAPSFPALLTEYRAGGAGERGEKPCKE